MQFFPKSCVLYLTKRALWFNFLQNGLFGLKMLKQTSTYLGFKILVLQCCLALPKRLSRFFYHNVQKTLQLSIVGGNLVSNPNQVLFSSELAARGAGLILKVLLNLMGRDASHLCLISTWPKEGCTIVCVNLSPIRYCLLWEWAEEPMPPS